MADSPEDRNRTEARLRELEIRVDRVGGSLAEIDQRLSAHQRHNQATDETLQYVERLVTAMDDRLARLEAVATTAGEERVDSVLDIQPSGPVLGPEPPPETAEPLDLTTAIQPVEPPDLLDSLAALDQPGDLPVVAESWPVSPLPEHGPNLDELIVEPFWHDPESSTGPEPTATSAAPRRVVWPEREAPMSQPKEPGFVGATLAALADSLRDLPRPNVRQYIPRSRDDLEEFVGRRILALIGGIAVLIGAAFFLSLAFTQDPPNGQSGPIFSDTQYVLIGLGASVVLFALGAWFFERRESILGHVILATGIGIYGMSLLSGTDWLIPFEASLLGLLLGACLATVIAIRANSQVVAGYGLLSALVAPPLLGADATGFVVAYVSITLIGTTTIALYRTWTWLPAIAFLLAAPQFLQWVIEEPRAGVALAVTFGFWLLNAVASGGEEFRVRRHRLGITSSTLLLLNAGATVASGFIILTGDLAVWRGTFLVALAAGHFLIGGYFLRRDGHLDPFGLLAFGTGLAAFSVAIPIQLGGPVVPIAWAAEAAALTWVYSRLKNRYCIAAGALLGAAALVHLLLVQYPLWNIEEGTSGERSIVALLSVVAAMAVAGYFTGSRLIRGILTLTSTALVLYALPFELSGPALVIGWALLFLAGMLAAESRVVRQLISEADNLIPLALAALGLAVGHLLVVDYPHVGAFNAHLDRTPFTGAEALAAGVLLAVTWIAAAITRIPHARPALSLIGFGLAIYVMPFELSETALVAGWSLIALAAAVDLRGTPYLRRLPFGMESLVPATVAATLAIGYLLLRVYPFYEIPTGVSDAIAFSNGSRLAGGAVLLALAGIAWFGKHEIARLAALLSWFGIVVFVVLPFDLSGAPLVLAWTLAFALGMTAPRRIVPARVTTRKWALLPVALASAGLILLHLLALDYPPDMVVDGFRADTPFINEAGVILGIVLAGLIAAACLTPLRLVRNLLTATAFALVTYTLPFHLSDARLVGAWSLVFLAGYVDAAWLPARWRGIGLLWRTLPGLAALALALDHFVTMDYPVHQLVQDLAGEAPTLNQSPLAAGLLLATLWTASLFARKLTERILLVLSGYAVVIYALPFELSGAALVGAWALVAVLAAIEPERLPTRRVPIRHPFPVGGWTLAPAALSFLLAGIHLTVLDLPWYRLVEGFSLPRLPLVNEGALAALFVIAAAALVAILTGRRDVRHVAILAGLGAATYLMPFQFSPAGVAVMWSLIGLLPYVFAQFDEDWRNVYYAYSGGLMVLAAAFTVGSAAPPSRLTVNDAASDGHPLLLSGATAALGAIMTNLIAAYRTFRGNQKLASILIVATGTLAIYILSIGLVDEFQRRVSDPTSAQALQEQASVGLSVLWSVLGVGSLVIGIARRVLGLRLFGFGILATAIIKVFIVDLASVDPSRKFVSFLVLGTLLLISSYLYQRWSPRLGDRLDAC